MYAFKLGNSFKAPPDTVEDGGERISGLFLVPVRPWLLVLLSLRVLVFVCSCLLVCLSACLLVLVSSRELSQCWIGNVDKMCAQIGCTI